MPKAQPVPRKYKSYIDDAQDNLKYIAHQAKLVREALESGRRPVSYVQNLLRGIEVLSYKTALELGEVDIATGCDSYPAAPPHIEYQALLLLVAMHLERLADVARRGSNGTTVSNIVLEFECNKSESCEHHV